MLFRKVILALAICFFQGAIAQSYKVMTYNIRYDNPNDGDNQWSKRKAFLSNQIAYNNPDVFGIQEGLEHQVKYLDSIFTEYNYVGVGRDDGKTKGEYSAIFYNKERLSILSEGTFWLSETPNKISIGWDASMERICTYGLFKIKDSDQRFWVFNAHFDHIGNVAREKSAELIIKKIKEFNINNLPVIVMGDFNLKPETKPIQLFSKVLNDTKNVSALKSFGPTGTYNGFNFNKPVSNRIDYVFTSKKNIKVLKYAVLSDNKECKYPSDHLPVIIDFEF
ncbi:endonuclease/exonuclease/phosphatase family protein [Jejuia spongiicola]|uniref:Endonuclease/exonuclease/phosphatase family protein n=1 Tax=Jejuia spongiicola TaxID=2942207 RepID=A0ABT0QHR3_9FLAO|nr:endonuclease/exonuclease/phosphatase family protein [Jejuia spongiicola]MCL6296163.1 endonuclease/exonuclease/phosphatase family protein [Jejuia spongiicola]